MIEVVPVVLPVGRQIAWEAVALNDDDVASGLRRVDAGAYEVRPNHRTTGVIAQKLAAGIHDVVVDQQVTLIRVDMDAAREPG